MAAPRSQSAKPEVSNDRTGDDSSIAIALPNSIARAVITNVRPQVDGGRRPAKATVGDALRVEADIFVDGHDLLRCEMRFRHEDDVKWSSDLMFDIGNDRWRSTLPIERLGRYRFMIRACVDGFATWRRDLEKRIEAQQDVSEEYLVGAQMLHDVSRRARAADRRWLSDVVEILRANGVTLDDTVSGLVAEATEAAALRDVLASPRVAHLAGLSDPELCTSSEAFFVTSDPIRARFSSWYEMFPRSSAPTPLRHGNFDDVIARLEYVESMGFDVLYLPPIHPIGRTGRKGRNGSTTCDEGDPGSPWAIGAAEGGHTSVHPELGSLEDFGRLVSEAKDRGINVSIDLAFQASPDHPWVQQHPDWFFHLPNGTIRYAENPPKKYEDIYPLHFEGLDWRALWHELLEVAQFWIAQGVTIFRVDNPHTKPFAFWEWLLASVKAEHPEVIFLSEAFTRPRVMEQLAKIGFTQSYTYFTWRSTKWEIESYMRELTRSPVADYFRPNFWPNTPDILSEELQRGGRAAFLSRFVLAATLSSNYGIYGPPFELQEHLPRAIGSEEYLLSEKYEIRSWDLDSSRSLSAFIAVVNQIRHEHPALQFNDALTFHPVDNDQIIAYSKERATNDGHDIVLAVVSLDHAYPQAGWISLDMAALGIDPGASFVVHDLLTDARYTWSGSQNFVKLDPERVPCHIFAVERNAKRSVM
ncbi:MAG: alpha-1,4-glucan--maltose-1-phosphate maltosyltransferase [Acidimicrobiales bacterium]